MLVKIFCASLIFILYSYSSFSQTSYNDSMQKFLDRYVADHEVVKGDDKKKLGFFPVNMKYRVHARVERVKDSKWFAMETSGISKQPYRVYAILHFTINDTVVRLNLYQSQRLMTMDEYKNHLFLPFTDRTSGNNSYETGRYIDLEIDEIKGEKVTIDFNKAYNPYCAYVDGLYNCPIPPKENDLKVAILAGEARYRK